MRLMSIQDPQLQNQTNFGTQPIYSIKFKFFNSIAWIDLQ